MYKIKLIPYLLVLGLFFLNDPGALAQGRSNERKEHDRDQGRKERGRGKGRGDQRQERRQGEGAGRVVVPPVGSTGPRQLEGVPPGHYPPPGQCRIWYPNRPPGHQPPPTDCARLVGVRLEPGAFILHGDRAYDAEYDWREEDRRRPGTVGRDILDILSPRR